MTVRAIRADERDNVAILTVDVNKGDLVDAGGKIVRVVEAVPRGQKVALTAIDIGNTVYRYGEEIGVALRDIQPGQHVHTHNLGGRK